MGSSGDLQCPHDLQLDSKCNILNDQMFRNNSSADYIRRASKVRPGCSHIVLLVHYALQTSSTC